MKKTLTLCILLSVLIVFTLPFFPSYKILAQDESKEKFAYDFSRSNTYGSYIYEYKASSQPQYEIKIPAISYINTEKADLKVLNTFEGKDNVLEWSNEEGWAEWETDIPESGLYNMALAFCPIKGKGGDIELEMAIDGKVPFEGALKLQFNRVWKDATDIMKDNRGNELRPQQIEQPQWLEQDFRDTEGLYNESYKFYFEKGKHIIRLTSIREPIAIEYLNIYQKETIPSYDQVKKGYTDKGYKPARNEIIKFQAEDTYIKSNPVLHPTYDKSSPKTEPYHPTKIRMNTIGGTSWRYPSQWITWKFDVKEDGLYKIGMRYRQNSIRGFYTTRKIYIDGKIPFEEMNSIEFPYGVNWQFKVLGNKNPYEFYFSKGIHEVTMEVSLGRMAETLRTVQDSIYKLNNMYRKIIMITSVQPDLFRDYYLEKEIPELLPAFTEVAKTLNDEAARLEKITGHKGTEAVLLQRIADQLGSFVEEPDSIPERLGKYKDNISALGAWVLRIKEQPLELDYITIQSLDRNFEKATDNVFERVLHEVKAFIGSFFEDYTNIGNRYDEKESLNVWIGTGRDQAQILKSIIDDLFTPKTGIAVNLNLVQGALLQATMAGKGPDVALTVARGEPVNLALRGALEKLDQYEGFEDVTKRFVDTAMVPYKLQDHYYALPETQAFIMMFYRTDIFNELGISPPDTWDELYKIAPIIQRNNMQIGLPYSVVDASLFPTLILQNGETFYNDDLTETRFDKPVAFSAFKQWTDFYSKHSFPLFKDDYSRFRTGEMPIVITQYPFYSLLSVAAPEIRNLWEMVSIPGVEGVNGNIDRTTNASGAASIILSSAKNKENAWQFLEWWSSAEVQARFGNEIEAIMGPAGRYTPANVEAFKNLPWSYKEQDKLLSQWRNAVEIPEVPGGYYTQRNIDNAFRAVVFRYDNPREVLTYWNREINKEIQRKRVEFGLDDN